MKIIIGAGGGYDIVVAAMIRNRLATINNDFDIGGFLNPKFIHFYGSNYSYSNENPINYVEDVLKFRRILEISKQSYLSYTARYIPVHFVDKYVTQNVPCNVLNFSLQFSPREIAYSLAERYQEILLCDVGGDILFFGRDDACVKTPIIDAFSLQVAHEFYILTGVSSQLLILGLGLDGELGKANLHNNLELLDSEKGILRVEELNQEDITYLEELYYNVKTENKGRTNQLLIDIWNRQRSDNNIVAENRNITEFEEWFNKIFLLDSLSVYRHNPLCTCDSLPEMNVMAKSFGIQLK